jgi:hypothetical protein
MQKMMSQVLSFALVLPLFTGCAIPHETALLRMRDHFREGEFAKCLGDIQQARRAPKIEAEQMAETLLLEALSYEGIGDQEKADSVYHRIVEILPETVLALRAEKRLSRLEADQLPKLVPKFDSRRWRLLAKRWKDTQFVAQYGLEHQTARTWTETITVLSAEAPPPVSSISDVLRQIKKEMTAESPNLDWQVLRSADDEAFYYFQCRREQSECGIGRVVLDARREHTIVYVTRGADLDAEERARWVQLLAAAQLQPRPVRNENEDSAVGFAAR